MKKRMRRILSLVVSMAMLILPVLTGCRQNDQPESSTHSTTTPTSNAYIPNDHPGLVDGLYVSCGSYDLTITSLSFFPNIDFCILSLEPLPADMDVIIDTVMTCNVSVVNLTPEFLDEDSCPLYLYQTMAGIDWKQAAALKRTAEDAWEAYRADASNTELVEAYETATAVYQAYMDQFSTGYETYLAERHTPEYYYYMVQLSGFDNRPVDEIAVIQEVTLMAGDWSYTVNLGEIRFDPTLLGRPIGEGVRMDGYARGSYAGRPWQSGNMIALQMVEFTAKEDLEITDIYFQGENQPTVEQAVITITANGQTIETLWKPGVTLKIRAGEYVTVSPYYFDQAAQNAEYAENRVLLVEYNREEGTGIASGCVYNVRVRESLEVYLWAVRGLDTRSYFVDYLNAD